MLTEVIYLLSRIFIHFQMERGKEKICAQDLWPTCHLDSLFPLTLTSYSRIKEGRRGKKGFYCDLLYWLVPLMLTVTGHTCCCLVGHLVVCTSL